MTDIVERMRTRLWADDTLEEAARQKEGRLCWEQPSSSRRPRNTQSPAGILLRR